MVNSKNKGKRGELEAAEALRAIGLDARRGQQYNGAESADLISVPGVHWEVKRSESFSLYKALEQAQADAQDGQVPVVLHRRSRREWVAVVPLSLLRVLSEIVVGECHEEVSARVRESIPSSDG